MSDRQVEAPESATSTTPTPNPTTPMEVDPDEFGLTDDERRDLDNWFTYHPPTQEQVPVFMALRDAGHQFAETIMTLVPNSPDRTVAIRHVRDAVMAANASLACYPDGMPPR